MCFFIDEYLFHLIRHFRPNKDINSFSDICNNFRYFIYKNMFWQVVTMDYAGVFSLNFVSLQSILHS